MHNPIRPQVLPMREGVSASCVALPAGPWVTVIDFLVQRLPIVSRAQWHARMVAGEVVDEFGVPVSPERPYRHSMRVFYYRALEQEPRVPFEAEVLHQDAHLLVVDKPHFLPVVPTGRYLHETLLVRLNRQLGIEALSRGASEVVFVDKSAAALKLIRENLELCGLSDRARVRNGDSLAYLRSGEKFDLVFLDPPYDTGLLEQALQDIAGFDICREHGIIMAESPADAVLPPLAAPYRLYREYRYGRIKLTVYHRQGNEE